MGWEVDGTLLFCNTADCHFGPQCASEEEACELGRATIKPFRDPRGASDAILLIELRRLRGEEITGQFRMVFSPYKFTGQEPTASPVMTYDDCREWAEKLTTAPGAPSGMFDVAEEPPPRAQIIDLAEALRQSLETRK